MDENLPLAGVIPPSLARGLLKFTKVKAAFTIASSLFCVLHWLISHRLSLYVIPGALVVGAAAATLTWWFSNAAMNKGG
jgi:hypothetical protein